MISVLIFSKNRPCQLDLLLRSIQDNFKQVDDIYILIKFTGKQYRKGYEIVYKSETARHCYFFTEIDFKSQVMHIIEKRMKHKHMICFCDDDVVIREVDINFVMLDSWLNKDVNALSLRMGDEITYSYAQDMQLKKPNFEQNIRDYLCWDWTKGNPKEDWYYPMSLAGNIYRKDRIIELWSRLPFMSPNFIEGYMNTNRDLNYPYQMSYDQMHVLNVANNLVQDVCSNRADDDKKFSVETLNGEFLKGKRLSTENLYDKTFNSPNLAVPYLWRK